MKRMFLFIGLMFLGSVLGFAEAGSVEVMSMSIQPQAQEGGSIENGNMVLYVGLKNHDLRKINNLNLEIYYYAKGGVLIQKGVVKRVLSESIPPDEERKFKIHLNRYNKSLFGSMDMKSKGQYPYDRAGEIDSLKIIPTDVQCRW